ncbi:DUF2846 domain-containing protein [Kiloniella antarctica]|uniref:DUF2846 domain-containing protein n=1 Tax=Kiloniella antarctica TaxID=1550907 RepID=A0ABW5BE79_9PROT
MSTLKRAILVFILATTMVACGASKNARPITGSLPLASDNSARIYFYRSKVPFLAAIEPEFLVDGKSVGKAVMNQAIYRDARPGEYEISISSDLKNSISLSLSPGETRYIRAYGTTSVIRTYLSIDEVDAKQAMQDLKGQKLLVP